MTQVNKHCLYQVGWSNTKWIKIDIKHQAANEMRIKILSKGLEALNRLALMGCKLLSLTLISVPRGKNPHSEGELGKKVQLLRCVSCAYFLRCCFFVLLYGSNTFEYNLLSLHSDYIICKWCIFVGAS